MNAVSHMAWDGAPPASDGRAKTNTLVGSALHTGAALIWGAAFEALFGRVARGSLGAGLSGGAVVALCACFTDYRIVPDRLRPGYERFLSRRSLMLVYAALGLGYALGARGLGREAVGRSPRHQ